MKRKQNNRMMGGLYDLAFYHTHDLDLGVSRSKSEKALSLVWDSWLTWNRKDVSHPFMTMILISVIACICPSIDMCLCVCVSTLSLLCIKSPPIQARTPKLGPKMLNTLAKILLVGWLTLNLMSKFITFWVTMVSKSNTDVWFVHQSK